MVLGPGALAAFGARALQQAPKLPPGLAPPLRSTSTATTTGSGAALSMGSSAKTGAGSVVGAAGGGGGGALSFAQDTKESDANDSVR